MELYVYKKDTNKNIELLCTINSGNIFSTLYENVIKYFYSTDSINLFKSLKSYEEIINSQYEGIIYYKESPTKFIIYEKVIDVSSSESMVSTIWPFKANTNTYKINILSEIGIINISDIKDYPVLNIENITGTINFNNILHLKNVVNLDTVFLFTNLKTITFSNNFNSVIHKLPSSVTKIILPNKYNIELPVVLPHIKTLSLGQSYTIQIKGCNFPNLAKINFGNSYNKDISLPNSVKSITIGEKFTRIITNLPSSLEKLYLTNYPILINQRSIPDSLKFLSLKEAVITNISNLYLPHLEILYISLQSGHKIPTLTRKFPKLKVLKIFNVIRNEDLEYDTFPETIEELYIQQFIGCFNAFLPNLRVLKFNKSSPNSLGFNISKLNKLEHIETGHQTIIPSGLPSGLKTLIVGESYNHNIDSSHIPKTLESLQLGNNFSAKLFLKNTSLKKIVFGDKFNTNITIDTIPVTLVELTIGLHYNNCINLSHLTNLRVLNLKCNKYSNQIYLPNLIEEINFIGCQKIPVKYINIDSLPKSLTLLTSNNNILVGHSNIITFMKILLLEDS